MRNSGRHWGWLLSVLVLASLAGAMLGRRVDTPLQDGKDGRHLPAGLISVSRGTVAGVVTDAESGKPLAGAHVSLDQLAGEDDIRMGNGFGRSGSSSTLTDSAKDGTYTFDLSTGKGTVRTECAGYVRKLVDVEATGGSRGIRCDIALARAARLSVLVQDPRGGCIEGWSPRLLRVDASGVPSPDQGGRGRHVPDTQTVFESLEPGTYMVWADRQGHDPPSTVPMRPPSEVRRITLEARQLATVSIRLGDGTVPRSGLRHAAPTPLPRQVSPRPELVLEEGHRSDIRSLVVSPDGSTVATAGAWEVKLWDRASGRLRVTLARKHSGLLSLAFSPDSRTLATGDLHGVYLWHPSSGRLLRRLTPRSGHGGHLAFSPDGRLLAIAADSSHVDMVDPETGLVRQRIPEGSSHPVFTPDGKGILVAGALWDVVTCELKCRLQAPETVGEAAGEAAALSPDGRYVATAGRDTTTGLGRACLDTRPTSSPWPSLPAAPRLRWVASTVT